MVPSRDGSITEKAYHMIPMKAPQNVLSLSVGGSQFPVVNGVVQVPPPYVKHALAHKFRLLDAQNADQLIESDVEAALAKAQAAIPIRGLKAKPGMKSLVLEGQTYTVGEDGYVEVPENVAGVAMLLGCKEDKVRPRPATDEEDNLLDGAGLRTDGPTLAEYVAAGYKAETYPPQGYSDKRTPEELEAAKAAGGGDGGAGDPGAAVLPTMQELAAKSDEDLRAWLKGHGVEFLAGGKRKDMNKAAAGVLAKLAEEAKAKAEKKE